MLYYPRTQLAEELVDALQGRNLFDDSPNGLFLAAPRRTGKSTFLQTDLQPALERRGVVVAYVDLWAAAERDPGELIAETIARALQAHAGLATKAARVLESVAIAGMKIDIGKIGRIDGATLVDALRALRELTQAPVALIIDEAQHSLTSAEGENVMMALKSARDQLNRPDTVNLMLVMSGSDRDKLLRLVNGNAAPFYGSRIKYLPTLGPDFVAHLASLIVKQRPELVALDHALLSQAFETLGHRPQFFMETLNEALSPFGGDECRPEVKVLGLAQKRQRLDREQMVSDFRALRPIEQAVLWRMLEQGPRFRPYDAEALRFYSDKSSTEVSRAMVQKSLENLRDRQPGMVWKSAHGEYAVNDVAMHHWYCERVAAGTWPPGE